MYPRPLYPTGTVLFPMALCQENSTLLFTEFIFKVVRLPKAKMWMMAIQKLTVIKPAAALMERIPVINMKMEPVFRTWVVPAKVILIFKSYQSFFIQVLSRSGVYVDHL